MNKKIIFVIVHVIAWLGVISLPLLLMPTDPPSGAASLPPLSVQAPGITNNPPFHFDPTNHPGNETTWTDIFFDTLPAIFFFYLNYYFLIPFLYLKKKNLLFYLSLGGGFIFLMSVTYLINVMLDKQEIYFENSFQHLFKFSMLKFVIVFIVSMGIRMIIEWRRSEQARVEIEREKLNAELSYLKAQINPHFLFNTLNSIYSLAVMQSELTAEAVMKLSKMMRYVTTEAHQKQVPLTNELTYIENYVELQKLRLSDLNKVNCEIEKKSSAYMIAPLLLIPFIENAFKHGVSAQEESFIDLRISTNQSQLLMSLSNKKVEKKSGLVEHTGIGLENTKQQLRMQYPKMHHLHIVDNDKEFIVKLTIDLR